MGRYTHKPCAYCGTITHHNTGDHVLQKALYPSTTPKTVQRAVVSACHPCNNSFSDDETHFRNMLIMCGPEPTAERKEIWEKIKLTLVPPQPDGTGQPDAQRRADDVGRQIVSFGFWAEGLPKRMLFPEKDPRFMRIIRKIIRGMAVYKCYLPWVKDEVVTANVKRVEVPPSFHELFPTVYHVRKVVEIKAYLYKPDIHPEFHSMWEVRFFDMATFTGFIHTNPPAKVVR